MGKPHPVDVYVGMRVRQRRTLIGLSQEKLGEAVGLTFQQIQKYERGTNRIACSRLVQFAAVLDIPVAWFFEDMPAGHVLGVVSPNKSKNGEPQPDPLAKRETLELARAYYRIAEPRVRKRVFELTKSLAGVGRRLPAKPGVGVRAG